MMAPAAAASSPPRTIASSTGMCQSFTNWAAASAPAPAKMICDSHSIPPSPVTTVKVRKVMP